LREDSRLLTNAIDAARAGDKARARLLLIESIKVDPRSADAWWWLAQCVDEPRRQADCLRRVLAIQPGHAAARQRLAQLETPPSREVPPVLTQTRPPTPADADQRPVPAATPGQKRGLAQSLGWIALGVVAGCLPMALVIFYLIRSTNLVPPGSMALIGSAPSATAEVVANLPSSLGSTWTPTPSRTPPVPSPSPNPPTATTELTYAQRIVIAQKDIDSATQLMQEEKYGEALIAWDDVLTQVPEFGDGHYQRAQAYLQLLGNNRYLDEYIGNVRAALDDIDQAITLEPVTNGDHFYIRYVLYGRLADVTDWRVDNERLRSIALENLRMAVANGTSDPYAERYVATELAQLGECDEAVAEANRLIRAEGQQAPPSGYLNYSLALGYMCQGDLERGLKAVDTSIEVTPGSDRYYLRSMILYQMGRLQEAKDQLDDLIEETPNYYGGRYYWRAAVRAEMGDLAGAQEDLLIGQGNTWGRYSMGAYAGALIAFGQGNQDAGVEDLRYAEASLSRMYGVLLKRVQSQLRQMDVAFLEPPSRFDVTSTPMATPGPTITPRPTLRSTYPPPTSALAIDASVGTGPLVLRSNDYPIYRFQPPVPIHYESVESLTVQLESIRPSGIPDLQLYFWSPDSGGWREQDAMWGANQVEFPWKAVGPQGDVYLGLRNWGAETIYLKNVRVIVVVVNGSGGKIIIGPDAP
jgi:tetratricopeptide (TPR) repeat protein